MRRRDYVVTSMVVAGLLAVYAVALAAPPQSMRFKKQVVMDKQGFDMEAFRLLIPDQWRFQGGVTWNTQKYPAEPFVGFKVNSPDGQSLLEHFPHHTCFWSQDPNLQASYAQGGADIIQPMSGVDYLRNVFLKKHRAGISDLKVLESGPLPELAKRNLEINRHLMNIFNQISPFTFRYELNADAGHLRVQYRRQGRTVVEEMIVSTSIMTAYFPGMYGTVTAITWIPQVKSFQAPSQEMGAKASLFKVMIDTYQENPAWGVACTRLAANIASKQLRQQQAIFSQMQQIRRTRNEVSDMIAEGYQRRSAAQDRIFDKYSESIRGVDTYRDPVNDREIELPTGARNAWTNGSEYIISDEAGYNPNIGSNQNWQQMDRRP